MKETCANCERTLLSFVFVIVIVFTGSNCAGRAVVRTRPLPPSQRAIVDIGIFYDDLAPYGTWLQIDGYDWVWTPHGIHVGWRPYTYGYWVYTDYGWTWVSRYRWGWAPFHYGRWFYHGRHGWVWVPGTVWAPAWVVWRHRPGWVGWAPMPPQVGWQVGIGISVSWAEVETVIEPHWYSFVEERYLPSRDLDQRIELSARNVTLLRTTDNVTNYSATENRIIDRGIKVERIEQVTGRSITRHRVIDAGSPGRGVEVRGNDVILYRPPIERAVSDRAPRQVELPRRAPESPSDLDRRLEAERRKLESQQDRERDAIIKPPRQVTPRAEPPRRITPEELQKQHEAERRALDEQIRRERDVLGSRQEQQRKVEQPPQAPTRKEKPVERKLPERKPSKP
ncbi:MAG: hypothetical protein MOB07_20095 [Acidobacteria bacterium]|nr:hypothetical protein [Acidobacteriota bacterium]